MGTRTGNPVWVDYPSLTTLITAARLNAIENVLDASPATTDVVLKSLVDAKGDIIVATADNTIARLPVGTDGQALLADSTQTSGLRWGSGSAAPDATTIVKGILQLAGDLGGTASSPTVVSASTTVAGKSELATDAEAQAMSDTARTLTPSNLAAVATTAATANRIILRDGSGRAKVATPSASDDIATKGYVDGLGGGGSFVLPRKAGVYHRPSMNFGIDRSAITANRAYFTPFFVDGVGLTVSRLATNCNVASTGNIRFGIYASTNQGIPGTRVLDAGTVAATSTGDLVRTFTAQALAPGLYWLAIIAAATPSLVRTTNQNTGLWTLPGDPGASAEWAGFGYYSDDASVVGSGFPSTWSTAVTIMQNDIFYTTVYVESVP